MRYGRFPGELGEYVRKRRLQTWVQNHPQKPMLLAPNLERRIEAERPVRTIRQLPDVTPESLSQPLDVLIAYRAAAAVIPLICTRCLASGVSVES